MTGLEDRRRFKQAFNRLAVATRLPADQVDDAMQRIYFEGLEPFPIEAVEDAARQIAEQADWFPKLAQWREVAAQARNSRALVAADVGGRVWHAECATCDDTGWEPLECVGTGSGPKCQRKKDHAAHSYVVPCYCRPTNRTYQRRMAQQREQARRRGGRAAPGSLSERSDEFTRVGE